LSDSDADTIVEVTFTASSSTVVLAWGGHIGSRLDWGFDVNDEPLSAGGINGSSYHMALDDWNHGNLGNMDRSLSAGAVIAPGNLIVIKEVSGGQAIASDFQINVSASTTPTPSSFSGNEAGTAVTIPVINGGTAYNVTEVLEDNYTPSYSADCQGTINTGENKVCTITNTFTPPFATLTLIKNVVNTGGGTATSTDWTLTADSSTTDLSGDGEATGQVDPGTYALSESTGPARYQASEWSCVINTESPIATSTITLAKGDTATCTITNTYVPAEQASIKIHKEVINDNGGTADVSTFQYWVNSVTEVFHNVAAFFDAETPTQFTLSESANSDYTPSEWNCSTNGGATVVGSTVTLGEGDAADCYISNDDISPKLTITKVVINDDQTASATTSDFKLYAGDIEFVSGVQQDIDAGTHTLSETGPTSSYGASYSCSVNGGQATESNQVTLELGDVAECTITNDDNDPTEATITIYKKVVNGFGGNAVASDFSFLVNGTDETDFEGASTSGSKIITVYSAGYYTITEPDRVDYTENYSQCVFDVTLGSSYSCTITNTQLPACSDGLNNDGREDSLIDYPSDPGCDDRDDNDETDPATTITIDKVVTGEGASETQAFNFNFSWTEPSLDLSLSATDTPITTVINPGSGLVITEDLTGLSRWDLTDISCTSEGGTVVENDLDQDSTNNSVTLNFSVGEQITCVFTNHYTPRDSGGNNEYIVVKKEVTEGSDIQESFGFEASWLDAEGDFDFMLSDGSEFVSDELDADEYYGISEFDEEFWSLESVSCVSSLDAERQISASEFLLNDGETVICTFTNDQELFELEGYVWEDTDEDGIFDEDENPLSGWGVNASAEGESTRETTSDENGYYHFFVPAGTWTISEDLQGGWDQTYPVEVDDFVHVVTVPQYEEEEFTLLENVFNFFIPTAHAVVFTPYPTTYGDYNFGNVQQPSDNGGGGNGRRIELTDDGDNDEPEGEVLGEATSTMPVGAPNTGSGGSSSFGIHAFAAILATRNGVRRKG
jgi:hypothetical protein